MLQVFECYKAEKIKQLFQQTLSEGKQIYGKVIWVSSSHTAVKFLDGQHVIKGIMRQSFRNFQHPPGQEST